MIFLWSGYKFYMNDKCLDYETFFKRNTEHLILSSMRIEATQIIPLFIEFIFKTLLNLCEFQVICCFLKCSHCG